MYRSEKRTESTRSLLRHTERAQLKMLDDGQVGYVYILYIYIYRCRSVDQKSESWECAQLPRGSTLTTPQKPIHTVSFTPGRTHRRRATIPNYGDQPRRSLLSAFAVCVSVRLSVLSLCVCLFVCLCVCLLCVCCREVLCVTQVMPFGALQPHLEARKSHKITLTHV